MHGLFHGYFSLPGAPSVSGPLGPAPASQSSSALERSAEGESLNGEKTMKHIEFGNGVYDYASKPGTPGEHPKNE